MAAGRKGMFEEKVKSRYSEIAEWLRGGASERQVAAALGVSYSAFNTWKRNIPEFGEFIRSVDRREIVLNLRSALIKKALGFEYEETKQYIRRDDDGNSYTYTEVTKKKALPDVAAINLALKNYDNDWANDPKVLELKRQELELKRMMAEKDDW